MIEIEKLEKLLKRLMAEPGSGAPALWYVLAIYVEETGAQNSTEALYSLYQSLSAFRDIVEERFKEQGRKIATLRLLSVLENIFSLDSMQGTWAEYKARFQRDFDAALGMLPLLTDLTFDSGALLAKRLDILDQIEKLRNKIGSTEEISDSAKVVLGCQLSLLERSLQRFEVSGVGPFRTSMFTIFGRVVLELEREHGLPEKDRRAIVDDFLRVYGIIQASGDILKLSGPLIAGLLGSPS